MPFKDRNYTTGEDKTIRVKQFDLSSSEEVGIDYLAASWIGPKSRSFIMEGGKTEFP